MALPNGRCFITQDVWPWKVSYKLLNLWATAAWEVEKQLWPSHPTALPGTRIRAQGAGISGRPG